MAYGLSAHRVLAVKSLVLDSAAPEELHADEGEHSINFRFRAWGAKI